MPDGFSLPEPGDGWYDERAKLAGRTDSAWTPNWAEPEALNPDIENPNPPPPVFSGTMSQASLAGGDDYDVPVETDQAIYGAGGGDWGNDKQLTTDTHIEADNPGAVDWYLTGTTPGSNPATGGSYQAPAKEWDWAAASDGEQADDLNVAPKPYGVVGSGGQDEEPDIGLSALASPAPGVDGGSGASGITDLPGVSGADDLGVTTPIFSN